MSFKKYVWFLIILVLVMLLGACATQKPEVVEKVVVEKEIVERVVIQTKLDETPRIAVVSAFGAEMELLLKEADIEEVYTLSGTIYHLGTLAGSEVVMFLSGVSMVNAAMTVQTAIDNFNVERIVYSGIAGGVSPDLNIGDVTVPAKWGQYLEAYFAREMEEGSFSPPPWYTPEFSNFGMIFPKSVSVLRAPNENERAFWFPVDKEMLVVANQVAREIDLAQCTPEGVCLEHDPKVKVGGNGVSGQAFIDNAAFREFTWQTFGADALDMETSAVGHVATTHGIPYIAFRSLSDLAGGGPGENQIGTFFQLAADNSATWALAFLEAWTTRGITAAPAEEFVFGMVLVGPHNDHGWSEAHYIAGKYVEEKVPGAKMVWLEGLNPADRPETTLEQVVDDMVSQGAKVIFTTSDAFEEDTIPVAEKYPDVTFINISGDDVLTGEAPSNEGNIMGNMVPMKGVAGCAASLATETGIIGYMGPLINFETRRLASAAYLGARYCYENYRGLDPDDLRFVVTWIGFWFNIPGVTLDPTEVSNDFFNTGADVVISGIDTTEALVVAGQRAAQGERVLAVPYDYEGACAEAPDICLGVPYFNWGPAYAETVSAVMNGTWKQSWDWNSPDWSNINNSGTTGTAFVFGPALTADQQNTLQKFVDGLASSDIVLYQGPLNLQDGTPYLKEGEVATPEQIWYLPQLLEGMEGPSE